MSKDKASYASLLEDDKKTSLNSLDLFDRVINIKLTTTEVNDNGNSVEKGTYVIRSDYETYFPGLMDSVSTGNYDSFANQKKCFIRKCQYKPSIKVQYKRVSMSTSIAVDIFIHNFFMLDKSGKMIKSFNNATFALGKVELAMGYFGQFQSLMGGKEGGQINVEDLFKFDENELKGQGITLLTLSDVSYVQTDKLPPDMIVHIHGFVGNLYSEKLENLNANKNAPDNYNDLSSSEAVINYTALGKDTIIEKTFFEEITRNWVHESALPKDTTIKLENSKAKGKLSVTDAEKYGIRVYLSVKAKEFAEEYDKTHIQLDSEGNKVLPNVVKFPSCKTAQEAMNAIKKEFGLLDFSDTQLPSTGDMLVFKNEELGDPSEMWKGTALESLYKNTAVELYWKNKLPAVYNITTDALCTISCPFFFFVNPFQKFYFKSRYALGGLVSYFANFNASEDEFYALWQTVSFATVEDINECTIVCTGKKKE